MCNQQGLTALHEILLNVIWQPEWAGSLGENEYMNMYIYVYIYVRLCHSAVHLNIVTQLSYTAVHGNPLQHSCLENPMDGGTWEATVHGVAKSRTQLTNFTFIVPLYKTTTFFLNLVS